MTTHAMFDGRLQVYKREKSRAWQMAARVGGQRFRKSTDEESLERAKDVAEEWYLGLRGKLKEGRIQPAERTFGQAAKAYMDDVKLLTIGTRSPDMSSLWICGCVATSSHILPTSPFPPSTGGLFKATASSGQKKP